MFKRCISLTICICFLFACVIGRVSYVTLSNNYNVDKTYNSYLYELDNLYSNFYYSNGQKINNNKTEFIAIIEPNEKNIGEINMLFGNKEKAKIIEELKKGKPIAKKIDVYRKTNYIKIIETKTSKNTLSQLISKQSKGLLYYDNSKIGSVKLKYNIDARGRILTGASEILNNNYDSRCGYKLTIDNRIQQITYDACSYLQNGCALVMDINNFNILGCVVKNDSCYLNKNFMLYNPGSIFKIIIAICALENNVDLEFKCTGKITVGDTEYSCQNMKAHANETLKDALANSCNCYFVKLALTLGYEKILNTIDKLGFNDETCIFKDWSFKNANIPTTDDLKSKGELALLGFGQGKIMVTPLQMARVLCVIANGGYLSDANLLLSRLDYNAFEYEYPKKEMHRVIDEKICNVMISCLANVVSNGTGKNAQSVDNKSAGKTATAQTGQYENSKELLNTWFVGVYPFDKPKYAIVVMKENGTSGSKDCCPIFRTIVENIPK